VDDQLINAIIDQVVATLRKKPTSSPVAPAASAQPAKSQAISPNRVQAAKTQTPRPAGKVFLTAELLAQRLACQTQGGALELADNEFLTPSAQDLVATKHITVHKVKTPALCTDIQTSSGCGNPGPETAGLSKQPGCGGIGIVVEKPDAKVEGLLRALSYDISSLSDGNQTDCWILNIRGMCDAIVSGSLTAGVAIFPYGADAMLLAGKIKGIRPVQGTRPASVAAAMRHYDANLLVLEHAFGTFHEMRQMVRTFIAPRQAGNVLDVLANAVAELER